MLLQKELCTDFTDSTDFFSGLTQTRPFFTAEVTENAEKLCILCALSVLSGKIFVKIRGQNEFSAVSSATRPP